MLDAINEKPPLPPKMRALEGLWPKLSGKKVEKVKAAAAALCVSTATIYRYMEQLRNKGNSEELSVEAGG